MTIGVDKEPSVDALKKIGEIPAIEEFAFLKLLYSRYHHARVCLLLIWALF